MPTDVWLLFSQVGNLLVPAILRRDPYELEFIQSVQEVVHSLEPVLAKVPQYDCFNSYSCTYCNAVSDIYMSLRCSHKAMEELILLYCVKIVGQEGLSSRQINLNPKWIVRVTFCSSDPNSTTQAKEVK